MRYLIPDPVVAYIEEHGLFQDDKEGNKEKAKGDEKGNSSPDAETSKG